VKTDPVVSAIEKIADVPVINLESALWHPMQGLADLQTMKRRMPGDPGDRKVVLAWAWHPKALPMAVPNSFLLAACGAGYQVTLAHPAGFDLAPEVMSQGHLLAGSHGGSLTLTHDLDTACAGADVIYAKSWAGYKSYGNVAADTEARKDLRGWIINDARQRTGAGPLGSGFMHCLPVRRNCIVTDGVIDGPNSWVAEQARNRLFTQAAVLHEML
jgi:N-acetylornithine carbamoyltransferase